MSFDPHILSIGISIEATNFARTPDLEAIMPNAAHQSTHPPSNTTIPGELDGPLSLQSHPPVDSNWMELHGPCIRGETGSSRRDGQDFRFRMDGRDAGCIRLVRLPACPACPSLWR
jgi:hypothetical protein